MLQFQLTDFLPTTKKECDLRGWAQLDVILFSGDAYVDHPAFGSAVIGRVLEAHGYRVAIVPQPDWHGDFQKVRTPEAVLRSITRKYGQYGQPLYSKSAHAS